MSPWLGAVLSKQNASRLPSGDQQASNSGSLRFVRRFSIAPSAERRNRKIEAPSWRVNDSQAPSGDHAGRCFKLPSNVNRKAIGSSATEEVSHRDTEAQRKM